MVQLFQLKNQLDGEEAKQVYDIDGKRQNSNKELLQLKQ